MKRWLAWDIETAPTAEALLISYPEEDRQPPSNYTKAETIAEWKRKDLAEWERGRIKEYSLSPRLGRIVALSLNSKGEHFVDLTALDANDEKTLIEDAWTIMFRHDVTDVMLGFNSRSFDWPFLCVRAMYHRIDPYAFCNKQQWQDALSRFSRRNIDVRDLVTFNAYGAQKGTLSDWAAWAGYGEKETHGSQVWKWVQEGNAEAVAKHCRGDVVRTGLLFERVYPLYLGA